MHIRTKWIDKGITSVERGASLLELIAFMVIVGIAASALMGAYAYSQKNIVNPIVQIRALELAQSKLDEVLALKYDDKTPTGGIPACSSNGATACDNTTDSNMNDVDDFNNKSDTPASGYARVVTVVAASNQKLVTVRVTTPNNTTVTLASYRSNF